MKNDDWGGAFPCPVGRGKMDTKGREFEKRLANGCDLLDFFEGGVSRLLFKVEREDGAERLVGGEAEGGDSGLVISERGVTKVWLDEIVGYAFDDATRAAMVEFFETCRNA